KLKTLDHIFDRVSIAEIKGSISGLPMSPRLHYVCYEFRSVAQGVGRHRRLATLNSMQQAAYDRAEPALVARLCACSDDPWPALPHPVGGRHRTQMSGAGGGYVDLGYSGGAGA